jgi:hypothetical protein
VAVFFGQFLKITEVQVMYIHIFFSKNGLGFIVAVFLQTRLVTLVETPFVLMQFYVL